jgi:hypothetical protein
MNFMETRIERINPYLDVGDVSASIRYYVDVLDFDLYLELPDFAIVEHGGHQIHICKRRDNHLPHRVWIGVEDVEVLFLHYNQNGARIKKEPNNYSWAYQIEVEDLDGNGLIIGSGPKHDLPFQE